MHRVKHYVENGLDKKYLRDPDNGANIMKKKADLGLLDKKEPQTNGKFPKEGFNSDLNALPKVSFGTIWRYMIDSVDSKKQLSTAKPLVKGFNFYKSGNVHSIHHLKESGKHFIKSQVLPSMKKNLIYQCQIVMSSIGGVLKAYCGCPAGIDGRCNHVSATLFALDEYCKEREKISIESCTSKPCKWNIPRKRKGPVSPISAMSFHKHDYSKQIKTDRTPNIKKGKDVQAIHQREWSDAKVNNMLQTIKDYQTKSGNIVGWSHILPQEVKEEDTIVSPLKVLPPSLREISEKCKEIEKKLNLEEKEITKVEQKTRGQSKDKLWNYHRKCRITASKCYRVASLKPTTSPTKALADVLQYNKQYQSFAMNQGLEKEEEIERLYVTSKHNSGYRNLSVEPCGLFISQSHGFLAATPDGLVSDPHVSQPLGLLEMKLIQLNDSESLRQGLLQRRICKDCGDNHLKMNTGHKYFYQIQQQMFVTQRKWTDFVVKGSTGNELYIERVNFNSEFWESVLPKLCNFFQQQVLPEMSYPRVKYGLARCQLRFE